MAIASSFVGENIALAQSRLQALCAHDPLVGGIVHAQRGQLLFNAFAACMPAFQPDDVAAAKRGVRLKDKPINIFVDPASYYLSSASGGSALKASSSSEMIYDRQGQRNAKSKAQFAALVAVVALLFADIFAIGVTSYYWIYGAAKQAREAKMNAERNREHATLLRTTHLQAEGVEYSLTNILNESLRGMATHLEAISNREKTYRSIQILSWTCLSAAAVGLVHAAASAIGAALLQSSITMAASGELLALYSFCIASFSAPILTAIAIIATVGVLSLAITNLIKTKKDRPDREAGAMYMKNFGVIEGIVNDMRLKSMGGKSMGTKPSLDRRKSLPPTFLPPPPFNPLASSHHSWPS